MRYWPISALVNWPRVTDAKRDLVAELVELGLEGREARWLVEEFVGSGGPGDHNAVISAARRRLEGEPLQYVIGHWPFRSLDLVVDPRVLIPRPETEELVDVALSALNATPSAPALIIDLGCGSGAIGLSLLDELRARDITARLVAVDSSRDALDLAELNARKHSLKSVTFVRSSWFDNVEASLQGRVDLIVANPPYVGESEMATLDPVLNHEPRGALVAPDAGGVVGFADLAHLVTTSFSWLRPGGALVLEHGESHRRALVDLAELSGYVDVRDFDDLSGRPRILLARRTL
jgi:release factor glutamine methyltransferase